MEHDAAMQAFSEFISSQSLYQQQIVYVNEIVDYIVQNGCIDKVTALMDAPFDKPRSFVKLFDRGMQKELIDIVNRVRENAVRFTG